MMPQLIAGLGKAEAAERARALLDYMRIGHRADHRPSELSGRRNSSAWRSPAPLPMPPWCCWPMSRPAISIRKLQVTSSRRSKHWPASRVSTAALIATHNHELASLMDRRVTIEDGKVVELK